MRAPTAVFVAISTSPAAGTGTGREWIKRAPGPPNASIARRAWSWELRARIRESLLSGSSLWFPAKRYGWGWGPPIRWQGWAFLLLWLIAFFSGIDYLIPRHSWLHVAFIAALVILLVVICY